MSDALPLSGISRLSFDFFSFLFSPAVVLICLVLLLSCLLFFSLSPAYCLEMSFFATDRLFLLLLLFLLFCCCCFFLLFVK